MRVMLVFSTTEMKDQQTQHMAMDTACPPWFTLHNTSGTDHYPRCICINSTDVSVKCDQLAQRSYLLLGYCMTLNGSSGITQLGRCSYHQKPTDHLYLALPTNISRLNDFMCGPLNRKGLLCRDCLDGFGPAMFTSGYACENCTEHSYLGVTLYLVLELVPITAFYLLVLVFQIRVTSAPLNGYIFFSQVVVIVYNNNVSVRAMFGMTGTTYNILGRILMTGYGIWNLEFFCLVVPPFCVSENIKNVHALMLQYISAIYPLCLIAVTYTAIKLHDHNFRPIIWLWRPFHKCFSRTRRSWDSQASIVDVFATFLLLSYFKFLVVSLYLLHGTTIHNSNGVTESKVLYSDATVQFFSKEHLPFAVAAIFILIIFILSPALLLLCYPTKVFRKCSSYCRLRRWQALHVFVEKFQGCYKDGVDGTKDFRPLAGLYMMVRIAITTAGITGSSNSHGIGMGWFSSGIFIIASSLFVAIARPYKRNYMNVLESLMLSLLGLLPLLILAYDYQLPSDTDLLVPYLILTFASIPQLVLTLYILYHPLRGRRLVKYITVRITNLKTKARGQNTEPQITDSLPDRLVNPDQYRLLLPVEGELAHQQDSMQSGNHDRCITPVYTYGSVN